MSPKPIWHPSPNFTERRQNALPSLVVLHYTAMESAIEALDRLCNSKVEVSAHYLISETGTTYHLIEERMRAWHAGAGQWGDISDVNSHSIGIELANTGAHPFSEPQMAALETLLSRLLKDWNISPARVIGHSDMAPSRKSDPGPRFDWRRLANSNLSIWPKPSDLKSDFYDCLTCFGYQSQVPKETLLTAFRHRFRPWANGPIDEIDHGLAADLAQRFSFDRTRHTA